MPQMKEAHKQMDAEHSHTQNHKSQAGYVEICGIQVQCYPEHQAKEAMLFDFPLVLSPKTRSNLRKILPPLLAGENLLLVGDAGVGKNALIYYINSMRRFPTIRYSFNQDTAAEDLIGSYRLAPSLGRESSFLWSDGALSHAMKTGATFVADEMNLCPPEVLGRFSSVFREASMQVMEGDSSLVEAKPGFNFVATQNPGDFFEGRKAIDSSIGKYFCKIYIDPYDEKEELEILQALYPRLETSLLLRLVQINREVEGLLLQAKVGRQDLEAYHFNLRTLKALAGRMEQLGKKEAGVKQEGRSALLEQARQAELCDMYLAPFRSLQERSLIAKSIMRTWAEGQAGPLLAYQASEKTQPQRDYSSLYKAGPVAIQVDVEKQRVSIGRAQLSFAYPKQAKQEEKQEAFCQALDRAFSLLPPVKQILPVLESIARSIEQKENVLLESAAEVEAEDYVRFFGCLTGHNLSVIYFSRSTHTSDVLGALKPCASRKDRPSLLDSVRWVDGPLSAAIRAGDWIMFRGLEACSAELIEKLNMLLDDAKALLLPSEAGENQLLALKPEARIFGVKCFRKKRNSPTLSRAFRNRFRSLVLEDIEDEASLEEYVMSFLKLEKEEEAAYQELVRVMLRFHRLMQSWARSREIGARSREPYEFALHNLKRWLRYIPLGQGSSPKEALLHAAQWAYSNEMDDPKERRQAMRALDELLEGQDLSIEALQKRLAQKQYAGEADKEQRQREAKVRKMWWDPSKHKPKSRTEHFKRKIRGPKLKQGIEIKSPETGGNTKEGPDAWYGSDTQGNKGQGVPGSGGGAWGYRTEELYQDFIRKRQNLWNYHIDASLAELRECFAAEFRKLSFYFESLFAPLKKNIRMQKERGRKLDMRRYIAYRAGEGSSRIFEAGSMLEELDYLKGLEILFVVNKGRRIFNFAYATASLVALMSLAAVLRNYPLDFAIASYSDLSNLKRSVDVQWCKKSKENFCQEKEKEVFFDLSQGWHGDTVQEANVLGHFSSCFSVQNHTKLLLVFSDFRGFRAKRSVEEEKESRESLMTCRKIKELEQKGVICLGIGLGNRSLAGAVCQESIHVHDGNFTNLPYLMAKKLKEMIDKHHIKKELSI